MQHTKNFRIGTFKECITKKKKKKSKNKRVIQILFETGKSMSGDSTSDLASVHLPPKEHSFEKKTKINCNYQMIAPKAVREIAKYANLDLRALFCSFISTQLFVRQQFWIYQNLKLLPNN